MVGAWKRQACSAHTRSPNAFGDVAILGTMNANAHGRDDRSGSIGETSKPARNTASNASQVVPVSYT